jgi:WD40 repeat protein
LLQRARQWKEFNRQSNLLTGEDLKDANFWLKDNGKRSKIRPDHLERELIKVSNERAGHISRLQADLVASQVIRNEVIGSELAVALSLAAINEFSLTNRTLQALTDHLSSVKTIALFTGHQSEYYDKSVHCLSVSKDSKEVASTGGDGTVRIWEVDEMNERLVYDKHERNREGEPLAVLTAAWSPDNQLIASGGKDGVLRVWEPATGNDVIVGRNHSHWLNHLAWSPDGSKIATSSRDSTLVIWDIASQRPLHTLRFGPFSPIRSLSWNKDGTRITGVSDTGYLRIIDAQRGYVIRGRRLSRKDAILSVDWHAENNRILTYSNVPDKTEGMIRLLDPQDLKDVYKFQLKGDQITCVRWSVKGDKLAIGTESGKLYVSLRPHGFRMLAGHEAEVCDLAWLDQDRKLVSCSEDTTVRIWTLEEEQTYKLITQHKDLVGDICNTPDGKLIISAGFDGTVQIANAETCTVERTIRAYHKNQIRQLAISPDGKKVLTGGDTRIGRMWDLATGEKLGEYKGFRDWAMGISWSPDGAYFAIGGCDIKIYSAVDYRPVKTLKGHKDALSTIAWSPNGRFLASTGVDLLLIIWDMENLALVWKKEVHEDKVFGLGWSPDSKFVVTSGKDGNAKVWEVVNENLVSVFNDGSNTIWCARWSPDGKYIACGSSDGTLKIWDPFNSQGHIRLLSNHGEVQCIQWGPGPSQLMAGNHDGTVVLWNLVLEAQAIIDIAKSRIVRPLTQVERLEYGLPDTPLRES